MQTIRELREGAGLTQKAVADAIGVTIATVYNWERGTYEPRASQLRSLAHLFKVPMEEIDTLPKDTKTAG
ncbi:MAG: helix-turn-helix domain-containing protein [Chloroflexota bacterium]|nr:helix-turn-helix domain-containing protein [Chloroflexota bacterium]